MLENVNLGFVSSGDIFTSTIKLRIPPITLECVHRIISTMKTKVTESIFLNLSIVLLTENEIDTTSYCFH